MNKIIGDDLEASRDLLGSGLGAAEHFAHMLVEEGEVRGLIGPREAPRVWRRHILNSAAVTQFLPDKGSVADVGSGAGLPGIVLAIIRPDLEFHLIEPMERRIAWLAEVSEELGLDNVKLHQKRAEELHNSISFTVVTARAVANMDKLVRATFPLVSSGGSLLALKGERVYEELEAAKYTLKRFKVSSVKVYAVDVLSDGEATFVAQLCK